MPAVTEEATSQELDKRYDILSLYFGRGRNYIGIGDEALLTFHLGPSLNIHPVTGTIISQMPSKTTLYDLKNATGNTYYWEEKEYSQHLAEIPTGAGGHLGLGLLWQVNLNLKNFTNDEPDEYDAGVGLGVSYVGTVTHNGIHTHLLLFRLSLSAIDVGKE